VNRVQWLTIRFLLGLLCLPGTVDVTRGDAIVNDVTQLNPIRVRQVLAPTSVEQVVAIVRSHAGPISIGGGRST
jgi:hypothetical protein